MKRLTACLVIALALWTGEVKGEWTVELLSGPTFTKTKAITNSPNGETKQSDSDIENVTNLRLKYWFPQIEENLQFAVGLEIGRTGTRPLTGPSITPIQITLGYLSSKRGIRPYLSMGPTILRARSVANEFTAKSEREHAIGLNFGAGIEVLLSKRISFITEYRYLQASFDFGGLPPIALPISAASQDIRMRSHSAVFGIGYRF